VMLKAEKVALSLVGVILLLGAWVVFISPHTQEVQSPRIEQGQHSESDEATFKESLKRFPVNIEFDPNCTKKSPDKKANENYIAWFFDKLSDDPMALLTAVLAVCNIALLMIVSIQAGDGKKAVKAAQASAETALTALGSERAWMSVEKINTQLLINPNIDGISHMQGVGISVAWVNKGRTPALCCEAYAECRVIEINDKTAPSFEPKWDEVVTASPIGPDIRVFAWYVLAVVITSP
jgi:hypothetical protein